MLFFFFLRIRRPPRSTLSSSSAASDVYKRQVSTQSTGIRNRIEMGWEDTADKLVGGVQQARQELSYQQSTLGSNIHASFDQLRKLLDDTESALTSNIQETISTRDQQLRDWERNLTAHRESLREGTREIQAALSNGDMALVGSKSKELEVSTTALKEMEVAFPELASPIGAGVDLSVVEDAVRSLTVGATSQGQPAAHVMPSSPPARSPVGMGAPSPMPTTPFNPSTLMTPNKIPISPYTPESSGRGTAVPNAIYINGVPEETTEADLREVFEKFGDIKMINSRHIATGGFAFIFFSSEQAASAALEKPKVLIHGKPVNILAKKQLVPKERSTPGGY
eukprot:TRINITY_DN15172_c0_g1_i1.p1 TRINITY_DN15172_c0_g1~~TRINITY_DN15172_c0_g1_i1.p1  ORF type:complete len:338 (-),score=93.38 TRINITY_DN15172_c0_g1_i1:172-1185(-)